MASPSGMTGSERETNRNRLMKAVKPLIEAARAAEILSGRGLLRRRNDIVKTELICLPVYLFKVVLTDKKGGRESEMVAVDAVRGEFSFYSEESISYFDEEHICYIEHIMSSESAFETIRREYGRILFRSNLKNGRDLSISAISNEELVLYPYWTGYYKRKTNYDFTVLDAIDGTVQGPKIKAVVAALIAGRIPASLITNT